MYYISNTVANFLFEIIKVSLATFVIYLAAEFAYRSNSLNHALYVKAPLITKIMNFKQYYADGNISIVIVLLLSLLLLACGFAATILSVIWPVRFVVNYGGESQPYFVNNDGGGISLVLNGVTNIASDGKVDATNQYCATTKSCRTLGSTHEPDTNIINMIQTNVTPYDSEYYNNPYSWGIWTPWMTPRYVFPVAGYQMPFNQIQQYQEDGMYTIGNSTVNVPNYSYDLQIDLLTVVGAVNYTSQTYNMNPLTSFASFENSIDLSHTTHELFVYNNSVSLLKINMDISSTMLTPAINFTNYIKQNWAKEYPACIKLRSIFGNISLNTDTLATSSKNYRVRRIYMQNMSYIKEDCMIYSNSANTMLVTARTEISVYQGNTTAINNQDFSESNYVDISLGNAHKELTGKFNSYIPLAVEYVADFRPSPSWNPPTYAITSIGDSLNSRRLGLSINNMMCYINSYDGFGGKGYSGTGLNGVPLEISLIVVLAVSVLLAGLAFILSRRWVIKPYSTPFEVLIASTADTAIPSKSLDAPFDYKVGKDGVFTTLLNSQRLMTESLEDISKSD